MDIFDVTLLGSVAAGITGLTVFLALAGRPGSRLVPILVPALITTGIAAFFILALNAGSQVGMVPAGILGMSIYLMARTRPPARPAGRRDTRRSRG